MRPAPRPVWVVASEPTGRRWAEAIEAAGDAALALPWSEVVEPSDAADLAAALDERPDVVLLTSANAVRYLPTCGARGMRAACVGRTTAEAARRAGFDVAVVGRTGAEEVARRVLAELPGAQRILFLRGSDARDEATEVLRAHGRAVRSAVAYETRPRAAFVSDVHAAPPPAAVVVGSPLAAAALDDALDVTERADAREVPAVAVGETTAADLRGRGFPRVTAASHPDPEAIVEALRAER